MLCLEVSLNGKVIATAGADSGVVSAGLSTYNILDRKDCKLTVHGITDRPPAFAGSDVAPHLQAAMRQSQTSYSVAWIEGQDMNVGDELTIRVVDKPDCDPPQQARRMPEGG